MAASQGTFLVAGCLVCIVSAITNSQELARYQQLAQFRNYPDELTRAALSPQQQSHILSDVQQHRFHINQAQRQPNFLQSRPPAPAEYQTIRQQQQQAYQTISQNPEQIYNQQNYQPFQPQSQAFNSYQPQPQPLQNYQTFNFHPQQERKPILLQPTYPKEEPTNPPPPPPAQQPTQTAQQVNNYRQPSYRPQQPSVDNYQQQFENYVVPERQKDYISQVDPPKNIVSFTPEPQKEETPAWVLETQPPTQYKSQKPYDSITFATESYKITTTAPRFVKYRPKTKPTEAPLSSKESSKEDAGQVYIKPDRKKLYDQLVSSQTTPRPKVTTPSPTVARSTTKSPKSEEELLQEELQRQIQAQLSGKDDVFGTLKLTLPGSLTSEQIANLPNLALGDKVDEYDLPTVFPGAAPPKAKSGAKPSKNKPQIKTVVIQQQPSTTVKPPTLLFEELTKGVLPAGADFELIRQTQDGGLEEVGKLKDIPQKKVTFVILEEQPDGSVKVQGVRGNEDGSTETKGEEVDSIIQKIQKGEIKLPPSAKKSPPPNNTPDESVASPSYVKHVGKTDPPKRRYTTKLPTVHTTLNVNSHSGPYQGDKKLKQKYQNPTRSTFLPTLAPTEKPAPVYKSTTTNPPFHESHYHFGVTKTTPSPQNELISTPYDHPPTGPAVYDTPTSPAYPTHPTSYSPVYSATPSPTQYSSLPAVYNNLHSTTQFDFSTTSPTHFTTAAGGSSVLAETLKKNGFFAMAKFLRQSGLETVLNETGPYTIFVPTDRAFRSLLVQLGGPDRAEIKFKENPRLLSGLLLHHVIPGSFKVDTLQDEMTGVSLAGTQLRVNTYVTQDPEWNDVKVTTINGAKVLREKSDVAVPQGVAHGVDRVMFPLPVGDILQTLQADREGRFSRFVRLLRETGVAAMLTGSKTYTVFAPTDAAFPEGEVERLLENRASARALVLRHVTPGSLYSAGMLFYQLRDSMSAPNQIQLSKEAGRVKVNNAQVVSRNIPATNGVIHAVDSLL